MALHYRVGDRLVHSEIALALPEAPAAGAARVSIEIGSLDQEGVMVDGPGIGQASLTRIGDTARVRVDARADAPELALRGFVQGVALPAALQLTGEWHIHAASVAIDGGVVALLAEPGTGKSVLAAALMRAGGAFFGDDGLVIAGGDTPRAVLGSPHMRLYDDVARALGIDVSRAVRCPSSDKWIVAPGDAGFAVEQRELPLRALVKVARDPDAREARFAPVKPADAALELLAAEFHPSPEHRASDDERARFETAVALARRVPMRAMQVPDELGGLAGAAGALLAELREAVL